MAYITNYNFNRITKGFEAPKGKDYKFDDPIIWTAPNGKTIDQSNPTALFARWEVNDLLVYKSFCKNTEKAIYKYHRIEKPHDSYRYVQPERSPSYHNNCDCERLHAEFERIRIPDEIIDQVIEKIIEKLKRQIEGGVDSPQEVIEKIKELEKTKESHKWQVRGGSDLPQEVIEKIKEFRKWWKENESLRLTKPDAFVFKLNLVFGTHIHSFEVETKSNSGFAEFDNASVEIINDNIYHQLDDLFSWAKEDKKRTDIFIRFAYLSYIGNNPNKPIMYNPTQYSEEDIKKVLRYVHSRKMDIIKELKNLYLKTYNPELKFDRKLLDVLGFEPCAMCYNTIIIYNENLIDEQISLLRVHQMRNVL